MTSITFFVAGIPKPAGSKTAFAIKKGGVYTGRTVVMDACKKTKSWQATVKAEAKKHAPETPFVGPIKVEFTFFMPRPKSHFGTGKNSKLLKPLAPSYPTGKPDVLKLARAVEDSMTGTIYADDSQIVVEELLKCYDTDHVLCGVLIKVYEK
jgi:Holliday junction resolvase RusA-like endonuclease